MEQVGVLEDLKGTEAGNEIWFDSYSTLDESVAVLAMGRGYRCTQEAALHVQMRRYMYSSNFLQIPSCRLH